MRNTAQRTVDLFVIDDGRIEIRTHDAAVYATAYTRGRQWWIEVNPFVSAGVIGPLADRESLAASLITVWPELRSEFEQPQKPAGAKNKRTERASVSAGHA